MGRLTSRFAYVIGVPRETLPMSHIKGTVSRDFLASFLPLLISLGQFRFFFQILTEIFARSQGAPPV
jgi:hypothetical protein